MSHGSFKRFIGNPELEAFEERHHSVLAIQPPTLGASAEERRQWAIRNHYDDVLIAHGLLRDTEGIAKSGPKKLVAITPLGLLLLEAIGRPVADGV